MATPFPSTTNSTPAQDHGHNQSLPAPGEVAKPVRTLSPGVHALNEPAGHIPTLELAEYSAPGDVLASTQGGYASHQNFGGTESLGNPPGVVRGAAVERANFQTVESLSTYTGAIPEVSCL